MIIKTILFCSLFYSVLLVFFFNWKKMKQPHILELTFDRGMRFNHDVSLSEFCRGVSIGVNSQDFFKHKPRLSKSKYWCWCILWCGSSKSILVSHFKKDVDSGAPGWLRPLSFWLLILAPVGVSSDVGYSAGTLLGIFCFALCPSPCSHALSLK